MSAKYNNPTLPGAFEKQYLNDATADMHFVFETAEGVIERVPVHKFVLIAYSEVFNAMLSGSWQETDDVKITDASPHAFKEFLRFFYFDEVELTTENMVEVFCLGQKYLVTTCSNACVQHMSDNIRDCGV